MTEQWIQLIVILLTRRSQRATVATQAAEGSRIGRTGTTNKRTHWPLLLIEGKGGALC